MIHLEARIKEEIVRKFSALPEVRRVILFGSRARGDAGERSDIDLAIDAPGVHLRQWYNIADVVEELETLLPIDLVFLAEATSTLLDKITSEGAVLYERRESATEAH